MYSLTVNTTTTFQFSFALWSPFRFDGLVTQACSILIPNRHGCGRQPWPWWSSSELVLPSGLLGRLPTVDVRLDYWLLWEIELLPNLTQNYRLDDVATHTIWKWENSFLQAGSGKIAHILNWVSRSHRLSHPCHVPSDEANWHTVWRFQIWNTCKNYWGATCYVLMESAKITA